MKRWLAKRQVKRLRRQLLAVRRALVNSRETLGIIDLIPDPGLQQALHDTETRERIRLEWEVERLEALISEKEKDAVADAFPGG